MIDAAVVLWWAAAAEPFGLCGAVEIYGFAICRYPSGELYRFSCDHHWQTVNDSPHLDEEAAKISVTLNYAASAHRIVWRKAQSELPLDCDGGK